MITGKTNARKEPFPMKKRALQIAVFPLVRSTYESSTGEKLYHEAMQNFPGISSATFLGPSSPIESIQDLERALQEIPLSNVDGIVLMSATFHLGDLALRLSREAHVPILVWALPEPPYNGGRVRLNSLVGAHLDCSNLYKTGTRGFEFLYGWFDDPRFQQHFQNWFAALSVGKALRGSRIGLIGSHAKSFVNLGVQASDLLRDTGCELETISLMEYVDLAREKGENEGLSAKLRETFAETEPLPSEKWQLVAGQVHAFEQLQDRGYDALAIRCWPEMAQKYGISPCAAMSFFMAKGIPVACEGDVAGALSLLALEAAGSQQNFLADISQVFPEKNQLLLWHCGVAPCTLWDGISQRTLHTYFAGGKGMTAGFVLKPGPVTLFRIDLGGPKPRMLVRKAQAVPTEDELKGTYVRVEMDEPLVFLQKLLQNGFPHHVALAYGDVGAALELFCKISGWEWVSA